MTPRGWAAFAAVSVLWGIPYLFIKIAVDEVSPAFLFPFALVALVALGEQHITSSLAAILVAAVPLAVALLATRFDHSERVTG